MYPYSVLADGMKQEKRKEDGQESRIGMRYDRESLRG
jgi:hypothetical protein